MHVGSDIHLDISLLGHECEHRTQETLIDHVHGLTDRQTLTRPRTSTIKLGRFVKAAALWGIVVMFQGQWVNAMNGLVLGPGKYLIEASTIFQTLARGAMVSVKQVLDFSKPSQTHVFP